MAVERVETRVAVRNLECGMYVSTLDRPWQETSFLLQGFMISTDNDIEKLRHYCDYVFIDIETSKDFVADKLAPVASIVPEKKAVRKKAIVHALPKIDPENNPHDKKSIPVEKELKNAKATYTQVTQVIEQVVHKLQEGKQLDFDGLQQTVEPMVASIIRNPDALTLLSAMKKQHSSTYYHSLNVSVLCVSFGRQLGLPKEELEVLAMGGLLFDIGKMKIDKKLLEKSGPLSEAETEEYKRHVEYGLQILSDSTGPKEQVLAIVQSHHERHDGSGYPGGLAGQQIPVYARMVSIVDCYDEFVSKGTEGKPLSPYQAVKELYALRDESFQSDLIEQFIQVIGLYPVGSIVELSSGEVGIILAQNRTRRLRPKVVLILDADKHVRDDYPVIDLLSQSHDHLGNSISIQQSLPPGSYGIDPEEYFL